MVSEPYFRDEQLLEAAEKTEWLSPRTRSRGLAGLVSSPALRRLLVEAVNHFDRSAADLTASREEAAVHVAAAQEQAATDVAAAREGAAARIAAAREEAAAEIAAAREEAAAATAAARLPSSTQEAGRELLVVLRRLCARGVRAVRPRVLRRVAAFLENVLQA